MPEPSSQSNKIEQFPFEYFEAKTAELLMEKNDNKDLLVVAEKQRDLIRKLWEKISVKIGETEVALVIRKEVLKELPPTTQDILAKKEYKATNWLFQEHGDKKTFIVKFMYQVLQIPLIDIFEVTHMKNWEDADLIRACLETNIPAETIQEICLENEWSNEEIRKAFNSCGLRLM